MGSSGKGGNSALAQTLLEGNDTELLKQIVRDLEQIKHSDGSAKSSPSGKGRDSF